MARVEHWVVEVVPVTEEELTRVMNEQAAVGFALDRVDYVKEAGVRRPQLAFLYFSREAADVRD